MPTLLLYIYRSLNDIRSGLHTSDPFSVSVDNEKRIEAYHGEKNLVDKEILFFLNAKRRIDSCMNYSRPEFAVKMASIKKSFLDAKSRGIKLRYLTEITKYNIDSCKELIKVVDEFRHLEGIMSNFILSESEYIAPVAFTDEGKSAPEIIYCNVKSFVEQQQYFFDLLWNSAKAAEQKIMEIEEGVEAEFIEIIKDPYKVQKLAFDLMGGSREDIRLLFSTANAFHRQTRAGTIKLLIETALRGVKVGILTPFDENVKKYAEGLDIQYSNLSNSSDDDTDNKSHDYDSDKKHSGDLNSINKLKIRPIEPQLQTKISILIVDRKYSLAIELKDDSKDTSDKAMGLASYSNSKSTVSSYVSIFESLWRQLDLYEKLKESNKQQELLIKQLEVRDISQKEFINAAAHELRNPIQPILGLSDILLSKTFNTDQSKELLEIIRRNAKRLYRLSEDILDVARIESNSLVLQKERINLNELIHGVITEYKIQIKELNYVHLNLAFSNYDIFVEADKSRLYQVLDNILSNAIKFTKEGSITIYNTKMKKSCNDDSSNNNGNDNDVNNSLQNIKEEAIVSIRDTGTGIEPEIFPYLFDKFTTRSHQGTGLGLYISKRIIEAHGCRIWAENNADGKGATFSFTLPVTK